MRKEIQALEWLLILLGLVLLLRGSEIHFRMFIRLFEGYFFLMTLGFGVWITARHVNRHGKHNMVVFHFRYTDEATKELLIKSSQLLFIVSLCILYRSEWWMFIPVVVSFSYAVYQITKHGRPKLIFQNPNLFWDAIFLDNMEVEAVDIYRDGVIIKAERERKLLFSHLDSSRFRSEVPFEENQLLDDVLLTLDDGEVGRNFISELRRYAQKVNAPLREVDGILAE